MNVKTRPLPCQGVAGPGDTREDRKLKQMHRQDTSTMTAPAYTDRDIDPYDDPNTEHDETAAFTPLAMIYAALTLAFAGGSLWMLHYVEQFGASL